MARRRKQQVNGPAALLIFGLIVVGSIMHACDPDDSTSKTPAASAAPAYSAPSTATVAPPPTPVDVATVATVETPTSLVLDDHRRVFVADLYAASPSSERTATSCQKRTDLALAKTLLLHKQVTLESPRYSGYEDVPAGYTRMDVAVGGQDYADTYAAQIYSKREAACPTPTYTPPPSAGTSSSSDVDVHVPGNLPDGALTGGFCARHWWC